MKTIVEVQIADHVIQLARGLDQQTSCILRSCMEHLKAYQIGGEDTHKYFRLITALEQAVTAFDHVAVKMGFESSFMRRDHNHKAAYAPSIALFIYELLSAFGTKKLLLGFYSYEGEKPSPSLIAKDFLKINSISQDLTTNILEFTGCQVEHNALSRTAETFSTTPELLQKKIKDFANLRNLVIYRESKLAANEIAPYDWAEIERWVHLIVFCTVSAHYSTKERATAVQHILNVFTKMTR